MQTSFEEFYAASYKRLLRQLYAITGDLPEAEDAVQEAFIRAADHWARVRAYDLPEAWVRKVALNLVRQRSRSLRRRALALIRLGPPPAVPELSPDSLALAAALRDLPIGQRQAVVLHYLAGLPVEQVVAQLGLSNQAVKSRLFRARAALSRRLDTDLVGEADVNA